MPRGTDGLSPSTVVSFLEGIDFPCSRNDLASYAEEREAPDQIVDLLEELPDQVYNSMSDVVSAIGQVQ